MNDIVATFFVAQKMKRFDSGKPTWSRAGVHAKSMNGGGPHIKIPVWAQSPSTGWWSLTISAVT